MFYYLSAVVEYIANVALSTLSFVIKPEQECETVSLQTFMVVFVILKLLIMLHKQLTWL